MQAERTATSSSLARLLWPATLAVGLVAFFAAACRALAPWQIGTQPLNSDGAVPLLMARQPQPGIFGVYYWGQDRFGAWPFTLYHGLSQLLGRAPTFEGLYLLMLVVLALAIAAFVFTQPRERGFIACALVLALVLSPRVRFGFFNSSQPYLWQWATLLPAWAALHSRRRWAVLATFGFSLLAILMSSVSAVMLLALLLIELVWSRWKQERFWWPGHGAAVVLAAVIELSLRRLLNLAAHERFHRNFETNLHLDRGHLGENARQIAKLFATGDRFPIFAAGVLLALFAVYWLWRHRGEPTSTADRLAYLTVVAGAFATVQIPILVLVTHVRANNYGARYAVLAELLGLCAALFGAGFVCALRFEERRLPWLGAVFLALAFVQLPPAELGPQRQPILEAAEALRSQGPGTVLLDGYWGSYLFAALTDAIPETTAGDYDRSPFFDPALTAASKVVVGSDDPALRPPPPYVLRSQVVLSLERAAWFHNTRDTFSTYRNLTPRVRVLELQPGGKSWNLCAAPFEVSLTVPAAGELYLTQRSTTSLAKPIVLFDGHDLPVRPVPGGFWITVDRPGELLLHSTPVDEPRTDACRLDSALLLPR